MRKKERELKVGAAIILRASGFTAKEIAKALGMSEKKVRPIAKEVEEKFVISRF